MGAALEVSRLAEIDIAGAYLIDRYLRGGSPCAHVGLDIEVQGSHPAVVRLLETVRGATRPCPTEPPRRAGWLLLLERTGRGVSEASAEFLHLLSFMGQTLLTLAGLLVRPDRIRWANTFTIMESAGLNALPIIATLAFFIGIVVAYLGASILGDFGASIFTVELVAYSILREFGVVITAVLLAGRSASSFTAELGSMKMRQEVDALRVMGLDPMHTLVAPRVLALVAMTPLLTFMAIAAGLAGGALISWGTLGISPALFLSRIQAGVPPEHLLVGMIKSPLFAFFIAIIGCRHGLQTGLDVASLGKRVTTAVVQSIFFVILLDAALALFFVEIGW
jgi:phospholipid/cholesterol/gamma-HCH transport system permease protein